MLSKTGILDLIKSKNESKTVKTFHTQYLITFNSGIPYSDSTFADVQDKSQNFAQTFDKFLTLTKPEEGTFEDAVKEINIDVSYEQSEENDIIVTVRIHVIRYLGLKIQKKVVASLLKDTFPDSKLLFSQSVRSTGETLNDVLEDIKKVRIRTAERSKKLKSKNNENSDLS